MSRFSKLRDKWYGIEPPEEPEPAIEDMEMLSVEIADDVAPIHGSVLKTKKPEYTPTNYRMGGRVVKAMPRELRKIKASQEKVEDD